MSSDLAVWIAQLPDLELHVPCGSGHGSCQTERTDIPDEGGSEIAVFDHLRPDSFYRLDEFPAILCRDMPAVTAAAHGQVVARVLKADPARPWPHAPWSRRATGPRLSLLVAGTAWFDLAGVGEESFSANDSWCLPGGTDHVLLEASTDFEMLEIEFPGRPEACGASSAVPEMLTLFATYSYQHIPIFGQPSAHAESPIDAPPTVRLDDRAHNGWARPWHLQEQGIQCAYLTRGAARLEIKGRKIVDVRSGTFWLQHAEATAVQSP